MGNLETLFRFASYLSDEIECNNVQETLTRRLIFTYDNGLVINFCGDGSGVSAVWIK
jgi:hypothetical protein